MKLWMKTYLVTLILSLVLINSGIYLVFYMTYNKDLKVEQTRARSTFTILEQSFERNMDVLKDSNDLGEEQLQSLLKLYEKYYKAQEVSLKLWKNKTQIYPEKTTQIDKSLFKKNKSVMKVDMKERIKNLVITKMIVVGEDDYYFYYSQPLTELAATWDKLEKNYLLMSILMSVLLAMILFVILRRLNKPIDDLGAAVEKMKQGNYLDAAEIQVKGKDDIAGLQESFNEMARMINDNILKIREEVDKRQEFVDNFAHELKSPLTSIYGFAEYVSKANISDEEKKECMDFIMEESNRMLQLSYTLLDMAKIRNKKIQINEINVGEMATKIEKMLEYKLSKNAVCLVIDIKVEKIRGNEQLIYSLIYNLICNSINAIHEKADGGQVKLTIEKSYAGCVIQVEDNGCGMDEKDMEHILEPFYRIDKARSRENGGTGLGLSLCSRIVKAHHGSILFESHKGEGTKVKIELPDKYCKQSEK